MQNLTNEPLFSVLIANYNNGNYLERALESIYFQSYKNWEIIIVDDASTDNSSSIYEKHTKNPRVRLFFNDENKGCGYTKRRCAEEAKGEICGFLDPDDALSEDALNKMVKAHLDNDSSSIVYSRYYLCNSDLDVISESQTEQQKNKDPYFFNLESKILHFTSFKKSYYLKTEGINPYLKRAVDQDLYLKLYDVGDNFYLNEVLYYYRIHNQGISTLNNSDKALYWHWVVIIDTAKRRNVNVEDLFCSQFIYKKYYYELAAKYERLKKYERLNGLLSKLKRMFV